MTTTRRGESTRRAATRSRLLEAAATVFAEKGAGGATIEEICDLAGFTRGAFYSNYESLDALAAELLAVVSSDRLAAVRAATERVADATVDDFSQALDLSLDVFFGMQPQSVFDVALTTELELYAVRHPEVRDRFARDIEEGIDTVYRLIVSELARFGYRFRTSEQLTKSILHAYFEHSALITHVTGRTRSQSDQVMNVLNLFQALTEPIAQSQD